MSNIINEELEKMKYLLGYQKGKVVSEQVQQAAPAAAPTAPDVIMKIQRILVDKYKANLGNGGPKGDGVDGKWGNLTQTAFEAATGGAKSAATAAAPPTTTNSLKVDPQVAKSKGFEIVKEDDKVLIPTKVVNGLIGSIDARDYDYVLLSADGSTFACQITKAGTSGASCYSSNKQTGKVVNKTTDTQSAKTNVGL